MRSHLALLAEVWIPLLDRYRGHSLRTWLLYAAALASLAGTAKYDPALVPLLFDIELLAGLASFALFYVRREAPGLLWDNARAMRAPLMGARAFRLVLLAM
jgi:hypothetical protein